MSLFAVRCRDLLITVTLKHVPPSVRLSNLGLVVHSMLRFGILRSTIMRMLFHLMPPDRSPLAIATRSALPRGRPGQCDEETSSRRRTGIDGFWEQHSGFELTGFQVPSDHKNKGTGPQPQESGSLPFFWMSLARAFGLIIYCRHL